MEVKIINVKKIQKMIKTIQKNKTILYEILPKLNKNSLYNQNEFKLK